MKTANKKTLLKNVIALNLSLVVFEIVAGIYSGSMALLADAFHNLGDVLALLISLVAIIFGAKEATKKMTFGYIKSEMMAAFINTIFLVATMIFILVESIQRFFKPSDIDASVVIFASFLALIINGLSTVLLKEKLHTHEDLNIKSAYLHMLGDAVISFSVAIGGIVIYFFGVVIIDSILSIVFSLYVIKESLPLLKRSFYALLDSNTENINEIEKLILASSEILSIHDLHLYRPNSSEIYGSVHIVFRQNPTLDEIETVIEGIRDRLYKNGITHFVIQPESCRYDSGDMSCQRH